MSLIKIVVLLVSLTGVLSVEFNPLLTKYEWKNVDFQFPNETARQTAITSGRWIARNLVLIDTDVYYGCVPPKVFVTFPKFQVGVPITLGTVSSSWSTNGPLIIPYPNYSWHASNTNCDGIISVFRVAIDNLNRLWVLDTGKIGDIKYCEPQLLVFNLQNDVLLRRYRFTSAVYKPTSLFITPIVDVRDTTGLDTMVYIADVTGSGIVMYSYKNNISWRAQNKLMYPDPNYGTFTISGESFDLMDGILGMSVSPFAIGPNLAYKYSTPASQVLATDRLLYFHALASGSECAVPIRHLDNSALWTNVEAVPRAFFVVGSRGVQSAAEAVDRNGNLFFGLNTPNAIACWDPNLDYNKSNIQIRAESELKLQFASGIKIVNNRGLEELWAVTCRFQKVMTGSMNFAEVNFRIQALNVSTLLNGGYRCSY